MRRGFGGESIFITSVWAIRVLTSCFVCSQLCDAVDKIDHLFLGWWLAERQVKAGGLNGRPEKLPDVCYSWWVLSSLCIMGKMHWIDQKALARCVYFYSRAYGQLD